MPKKLENVPTKETLAEMLQTLSGKQCAKALGLSKMTMYRLMHRYGLKAAPEALAARQAYAVQINAERFRALGGLQKGEANPYWKGGVKASRKRWKDANREAYKPKKNARAAVQSAIRRGLLMRGPCEVCGSLQVQAHHDDYSKRLEVRWLCPRHHADHHMNERKKQH